jgi:hypothetical protein
MFEFQMKRQKKAIIQWLMTDEASKLVYGIGATAAQGAKFGFGLGGKVGGGKLSWKNLILQIGGGFLAKTFGIDLGLGQQQEQPQQTPPQQLEDKQWERKKEDWR